MIVKIIPSEAILIISPPKGNKALVQVSCFFLFGICVYEKIIQLLPPFILKDLTTLDVESSSIMNGIKWMISGGTMMLPHQQFLLKNVHCLFNYFKEDIKEELFSQFIYSSSTNLHLSLQQCDFKTAIIILKCTVLSWASQKVSIPKKALILSIYWESMFNPLFVLILITNHKEFWVSV